MSHHYDHNPDLSHDHSYDHADSHDHHGYDHHHGHAHRHTPLTFAEKLEKLLDHWVQHNDHHVTDYRQWALQARENDQGDVADLLEAAAQLTETVSGRFREARQAIDQTAHKRT